jgi:hypothetical protein
MITKLPLQKILQGILHKKVKANKTMKGQAVQSHRRRKDKKVEITLIELHTIKLLSKKRN